VGVDHSKEWVEKSSWDVVAHELDFILEAIFDGCCEDCTDSEQEKVMISPGGSP
jgi:uncharacterized protein YqjF (DUF2071 family)